ncbi:MAG: cytochrome o ubiquinol oxidase subunit IV [Candidatus Liptonbacteria bacterium RIFCSPLOWO2_01_FULL_52_25]|uniref:Cytochrome o ubiquinol oxidase subunit IV n=1 Tax=Candidatus Liptonbacteria bacterium RIFCSPLOWO2_01_FULL_52_25 TaxID=1798650 RepID=A0A1G2CDP8_9BACT|nr:MAG: cytochrome o ubiquinol oxidase subunit IV [Candidatus Liptonbacteria bacterium RIFCSPLOWO2_01_FULL_52_25]
MNLAVMKSYIVGFAASLALTLTAYFAIVGQWFTGQLSVVLIVGLAIAQFVVQLFFFLHIGKESGPRWNLAALVSTIGVLVIVIAGALWIMGHLNYNMMPGAMDVDAYLMDKEGIRR